MQGNSFPALIIFFTYTCPREGLHEKKFNPIPGAGVYNPRPQHPFLFFADAIICNSYANIHGNFYSDQYPHPHRNKHPDSYAGATSTDDGDALHI